MGGLSIKQRVRPKPGAPAALSTPESTVCSDCPTRGVCTSLCAEAQLILHEEDLDSEFSDTGGVDFNPDGFDGVGLRVVRPKTLPPDPDFSAREKAVLQSLASGMTRREICKKLGITATSLRGTIASLKRKWSTIQENR